MNAPLPNFTSSTSESMPSASFFDRMLAHDERDALDRAGDVAQRVECACRPARCGVWPIMQQPTFATMARNAGTS
jgi:hypothetical protein